MNEAIFLSLIMKARVCSSRGERSDYWHGYQRGLRRGFQGELFGTEDEHRRWIRLAENGNDEASRERGRGYRDGLSAYRRDIVAAGALAESLIHSALRPFGPTKRGSGRLL